MEGKVLCFSVLEELEVIIVGVLRRGNWSDDGKS